MNETHLHDNADCRCHQRQGQQQQRQQQESRNRSNRSTRGRGVGGATGRNGHDRLHAANNGQTFPTIVSSHHAVRPMPNTARIPPVDFGTVQRAVVGVKNQHWSTAATLTAFTALRPLFLLFRANRLHRLLLLLNHGHTPIHHHLHWHR